MDKRLIGILGEKLVCKWYTDRKYKLLGINYKTRFGEIDIIAQNRNTVVFVEVKTRKDDTFYSAKEAVTYTKQHYELIAEHGIKDFYRKSFFTKRPELLWTKD